MNIVLFCGGRGSTALIKEIVRWPGINLTLIVNAYDDGLSTGAIRRAIPGFLGPSDFRKNLVSTLLQSGEEHLEMAKLLEHRLKVGSGPILDLSDLIIHDSRFRILWDSFKDSRKNEVERYISVFIEYLIKSSTYFDFEDCAIGNVVYAGAYLENANDFQVANAKICRLIGVNANIVSVSNEETHLIGLLEDGTVLKDESSIVNLKSTSAIAEIFLMPKLIPESDLLEIEALNFSEKVTHLEKISKTPNVTSGAVEAIRSADLVLYGSGTQHSSLLPSYMVLARNGIKPSPAVPRVLIMNLEWDYDIQGWSIEQILSRFNKAWGIGKSEECITHVLIDNKSPFLRMAEHQNLDLNILQGDFRNSSNSKIHSGFAVYREIQKVMQYSKNQHCDGIKLCVSLHNKQILRREILEMEIGELNWPERIETEFEFSNSPEENLIRQFDTWLNNGADRYFVGCTGHGQYAMGDVLLALQNMPESMSAMIIGNRFRTRNEWIVAKRTAFEEKRMNQFIATVGSLIVNILVGVKFRKSIADPFSRIFIVDRLALPQNFELVKISNRKSILGLYTHFWKHNLITSEFQVKFRATFGESADRKLISQGFKELWKLGRS